MSNKENKGKFWDSVIGTIILFLIIFFGVGILTNIPLVIIVRANPGMPDFWQGLILNYLSVGLMGIGTTVIMAIWDKESFKTMLPGYGNNNAKMLLWGLLAGLASNASLALIAVGAGDISISFRGMNIFHALIAFVIVALQSSAEEVVERVFLYRRFERRKGAVFAIIANAVIFASMHIMNLVKYDVAPMYSIFAMLNILLVAVFLSVMVYYGGNVFFAFAFHSAWNYSQNFIFGLPNSGVPATESIFGLVNEGRDSLLYSKSFGIEATLGAVIVLTSLTVITIIVGRKKKAKNVQTENITE